MEGENRGILERIKDSAIVKKLRGVKNLQIIIVIFIIAIGLIIYSNIAAGRSAQEAPTTQMTSEELRLSGILGGIEGAGSVEAMITERDGEIVGVLVVADGAEDITVRMRLLEATAQALGVPKRIVSVFSRK